MGNYCILNGINSNELTGLLVSSLPPISKPLMRTQIETIDGRDGDIVTNLGYSAYDKQMEIGLYGDYDIDEIIAFFGSEGTVTFSNEPDKYYLYTIVDQIDFERLIRYRKATVTFHVQPFKYDATETEIDFTNTYTEDTEPYIFRANQHDANMMKLRGVVGGTIAWNQIIQNGNFADGTDGWIGINTTLSASNNVLTLTCTGASSRGFCRYLDVAIPANHVIMLLSKFKCNNTGTQRSIFFTRLNNGSLWTFASMLFNGTDVTELNGINKIEEDANRVYFYPMQNGAVGDTLEVYYVNLIDLTQMFGSTTADYIYSLEQRSAGAGVAWFKALFGEDYYPYNSGELLSVKTSARKTYNADNVEIGSYPLDDNLTLRGIPKLDSNNELYYDGDTYASDGTVARKYKEVTLNGDSTYTYQLNGQTANANNCYINFGDKAYGKNNFASNRFVIAGGVDVSAGTMVGRANLSGVEFRLPNTVEYTQEAYKAWFASNPTTVVYELATPTTESADAYTQSQRVGATEEFVDERSVPIPVGNDTLYYDGTPEIVVTNTGNAISKPILTIYGSGDITVSLNSNQIFSIALGDYEYITIDTNAMEAYMGGVLLNRLVTGDYADFSLAVGDNTLSFTGDVSEVLIENYSRWI